MCNPTSKRATFSVGSCGGVLFWLDVDGDVGVGAVVVAQEVFYLGGFVVGLVEGYLAVHEDVELDGVVVADAAGAQVVGLDVAGQAFD